MIVGTEAGTIRQPPPVVGHWRIGPLRCPLGDVSWATVRKPSLLVRWIAAAALDCHWTPIATPESGAPPISTRNPKP